VLTALTADVRKEIILPAVLEFSTVETDCSALGEDSRVAISGNNPISNSNARISARVAPIVSPDVV